MSRFAVAWLVVGLMVLGGFQATSGESRAVDPDRLALLETRLDELRARWNVPGMSAAIVKDGRLMWAKGFGHADVAHRRPAAPDTVYHLASLTKPFAAVVLLQALEAGQLDLETPVSRYGIELESQGTIRVKHLFTHTSEGVPGETYRYHGARFGELDKVITAVTGASFAAAVSARILEPLALRDTSPNPAQAQSCAEAKRDAEGFGRRLAQGYDSAGVTPVAYPRYFGAAAGLVSTVEDVGRFSIALDDDRLLRAETRQRAFAPSRSTKGERLPYGLGWFVQESNGLTLVWHYGLWTGTSSLILKVPQRQVTFVVLANSDGLSRPFALGGGDVLRSPFAREFLAVSW
jgi:CubicO group peptidase (beta-lactamase class C family)